MSVVFLIFSKCVEQAFTGAVAPHALQAAGVRDQGKRDSPDLSDSRGVRGTMYTFRVGGRALGSYWLYFFDTRSRAE